MLVIALVLVLQLRQSRTFDPPEPALGATDDPEVVERGRYLVFPNITPDPETGAIAGWTEDQFGRPTTPGNDEEGRMDGARVGTVGAEASRHG